MSSCGRNSKGIEPAIGQNDSNDEIIIKVEPLDYAERGEPCSSTSPEASLAITTGYAQPYHQLPYPSMATAQMRRYPDHSQKQHFDQVCFDQSKNLQVAFDNFKNQILGSIKLEFPNATDEEAYHIASKRWNMLSEEQKRPFQSKEVQQDSRGSNSLSSRLRGIHYDVTSNDDEQGCTNDRSAAKFGKCTWCKAFGNLNDYSSNLQGREIYCTGLCSKKCFEQAALKILNVEAGYGLESSVYPESIPIRTSLETLAQDARDRRRQSHEQQSRFDSISRFDAPRFHPGVVRGTDLSRPFHGVTTPPCSVSFPATRLVGPMWNINNVKSLRPVERNHSVKQDPECSVENAFQWNEYIRRTGSTVAPLSCFRKSRVSFSNLFQPEMKLEMKHPADELSYCIATVVDVCGPRLHLRLDGCSNRDDVWLLCDSSDIHPIGWCKEKGLNLKEPEGFPIDGESYIEFVQKTLKSTDKFAPISAFGEEPQPPNENGFAAGMKLEAVDKSDPFVIGVASVVEVNEDRIRIQFDGFKGSGYWTTYLDRDLFNVGWCYANGYPLRPPGFQVIRLEGFNAHSEYSNLRQSPIRSERNCQQMPNAGEVDVHINSCCYAGPYLDPERVSSLSSTYKGYIGFVLKAVLEDLIRCAHDQKTVFGFLKPGRGNILINAVSDGKIYNCHLSNVDRVSTFWKVMEQFCDNLRCCTNLLSGFKLQSTCPQCGQGPLLKSKELSFSSNMIQSMQKRPSTDQAEKHSCISSTPDSTAANTVEVSSIKPSTSSESPKRRRLDSALSHAVTSPRTWSIDEVAKLVEKTDLKDYVTLLRENDIDGKALLLLQRDIVISYMGLKIGPAVKLLDLIEDLKEIDARFR